MLLTEFRVKLSTSPVIRRKKEKMDKPIKNVWIEKEYKEGDIDLGWSCEGVGFGHLAFYVKDEKIYCNNETMGKDFVKAVLNKLVDEAIFTE